jgi:hypothetical protein
VKRDDRDEEDGSDVPAVRGQGRGEGFAQAQGRLLGRGAGGLRRRRPRHPLCGDRRAPPPGARETPRGHLRPRRGPRPCGAGQAQAAASGDEECLDPQAQAPRQAGPRSSRPRRSPRNRRRRPTPRTSAPRE